MKGREKNKECLPLDIAHERETGTGFYLKKIVLLQHPPSPQACTAFGSSFLGGGGGVGGFVYYGLMCGKRRG